MMRSLSSAVAGLRTHQTKMDVIGNNIANVNTYGFKSSRATFADVYYQNIAGSKAGQAMTTGGKNPTQIGYGASVATIDVMMNVSGSSTTDRALDVRLTGEGFLVTKDAAGRTYYSRMGNMGFDAAGNLVDGNGYLVQGFPMKVDPDNPEFMIPDVPATGIADPANLQGIWCDPRLMERMTGIAIGPNGQITGLLAGEQMITKKGGEDWIKDLNMPETSTYSGQVRWSVSALPRIDEFEASMQLAGDQADAIKEIVMGDVALPLKNEAGTDIQYLMKKNGNQIEIEMQNAQPPMTLVGELRNNQIVFMSGNYVAFTVKFDPLAKVTLADIKPQTENSDVRATMPGKVIKTDAEIIAAIDPDGDYKDKTVAGNQQYYVDGSATPPGVWPDDFTELKSPAEIATIMLANLTPSLTKAQISGDATNADYAAYVKDGRVPAVDAGGNPVWVQQPVPLTVALFEQIKTTDKGGNTVIRGRSDGSADPRYTDRTDVPTEWVPPTQVDQVLTYGDISFTLGNDSSMDDTTKIEEYFEENAYNSIMAIAGAQEETAFIIGQLVLAKFQNAAGLMEAGTSMFTSTNNSGEPILAVPGLEGTGSTAAGQLEMSNVDISKEFTDMITTQRGFQANSRIVTVSDEMLQELVNLKR